MAGMKKIDRAECSKVIGGSRGVGGPGGMLDTAGNWKDLTGAERVALQQASRRARTWLPRSRPSTRRTDNFARFSPLGGRAGRALPLARRQRVLSAPLGHLGIQCKYV